MAGYIEEVDIANRALQHCGVARTGSIDDSNDGATETKFVYDKARQAELRDNLWSFATRRAVLRPVDTVTAILETNAETLSGATLPFSDTEGVVVGQLATGTNIASGSTVLSFVEDVSVTLSIAISGTVALGAAISFGPLTFLWTPPAYAAGTTYAIGHISTYANEWWQSKVAGNLANTPTQGSFWRRYTGPDSMQVWDTDTSFYPGELALGSNGTVYLSLNTTNEGHDPTTTTGFWLAVNGTVGALSILYPIGSGPWTDWRTANVFRLPRGYLRKAPTAPKAGIGGYLGVPTGMEREDWVIEGDYIVSAAGWGFAARSGQGSPGALLLRYVADFVDVLDMPAMFCEMLAARIANEVAPMLVPESRLQATVSNIRRHYIDERRKAILQNGIEIGPTDPPLDSYITCRW